MRSPVAFFWQNWLAVLAAALLRPGGAPLVLMAWLFGEPLVRLAYGPSYAGAEELLSVVNCALVFILPNGIINQAALALGLEP